MEVCLMQKQTMKTHTSFFSFYTLKMFKIIIEIYDQTD